MNVQKGQEFIESQKLSWSDVGPGVRRKIAAHDDSLMTVFVEFQKGAVGDLHKHPHRQISFVESGKFEVHIGGKMQLLAKGDFFYVPPNVEHGVTAIEVGVLVDIFTPAREDFLQQQKK
jgi:quercetin dioxygenase-like cupin family protein